MGERQAYYSMPKGLATFRKKEKFQSDDAVGEVNCGLIRLHPCPHFDDSNSPMATDPIKLAALVFSNYKSFKGTPAVIPRIAPVNVIIGRNNSGKTAILDVIEAACKNEPPSRQHAPKNETPLSRMSMPVTKEMIECIPYEVVSHNFGRIKNYLNNSIQAGHALSVDIDYGEAFGKNARFTGKSYDNDHYKRLAIDTAHQFSRLFDNYTCLRLSAERDIKAEVPTEASLEKFGLKPDGTHATSICSHFINRSGLEESTIEVEVLSALNAICGPDIVFSKIQVQLNESGPTAYSEIYLTEQNGYRIVLSHMGSGIKTIMLVLLNLLVLPKMAWFSSRPLDRCIFCFEELENNLHPAMQRRLFRYISDFAIKHKSTFFLTTHSPVVIDLFGSDVHAQLIHVQSTTTGSQLTTVSDYNSSQELLNDLDVRASDLLQANGVIWVEGPSDRIYLNKWIELWTNGELKDNIDYQCLFFAGSLNAHMSFAIAHQEDNKSNRYAAFRVNRNCILIADSDSRKEGDKLKLHTDRIVKEMKEINGLTWITDGREVENYIPPRCIEELCGKAVPKPRTVKIHDWINKNGSPRYEKVELAEKITSMLTRADIEKYSDLPVRLNEICNRIRQWNGRRLTTSDSSPETAP